MEEEAGEAEGVAAAAAVRGAAHGAPVQTQGATQSKIGAAVEGQTAIQSKTLGVTLEERQDQAITVRVSYLEVRSGHHRHSLLSRGKIRPSPSESLISR